MEWQPIETAPKDGTELLLFDGKGILTGLWWAEMDGWFDNARSDYEFDPTHWMPLPAAPVEFTPEEVALFDKTLGIVQTP